MGKLISFLFCCLIVWACENQKPKRWFVSENESLSENRKHERVNENKTLPEKRKRISENESLSEDQKSKKQKTESQSVDESKSFSENLKNLKIPDSFKLEEIVIGNEKASHTLIVYSSFSCNHCCKFHREEFPKLKKQYIDSGKLKVILRNYIDDLGALEAAILMRIFYKESKDAIALYKLIFDSQEKWLKSKSPREFLKQVFVEAGYDGEVIANYLNTENPEYKKISAGLMKEQQRAMHELKISSVPAFVLDGSVHQGILTSKEIVEKLGINSQKRTAER